MLVRGALTLDVGLGRIVRPLGPLAVSIAAPRELVFELISGPYLQRTPRALTSKLRVLERGSDMALAEHFTPVGPMVATTLETVRFTPPSRVNFRLVRGPVPHVVEQFELRELDGRTEIEYCGELGTELLGARPMVGRPRGATVGGGCPLLFRRCEGRGRAARRPCLIERWAPRIDGASPYASNWE